MSKSISAYEQGRSVPPFAKLKQLAQVTHQPLSYFTDDNINQASLATKILGIEREL